MVAAEAKVGKTWTCLQIARDLATSRPIFGHPLFRVEGNPRVHYIEQEVDEDEMHNRIKISMSDLAGSLAPDRLWTTSRQPLLKLDDLHGPRLLRESIKSIRPNILILDPVSRLMYGDDASNKDVDAVFNEIDKLLVEFQDLDLSVILVHHYGKGNRNAKEAEADRLDPYEMRGASSFKNSPDSILTMIHEGGRKSIQPTGGWKVRTRLTTRHNADIPDFTLGVHLNGMIGVRHVPDKPIDNVRPISSGELKPRKAS